MDEYVPRQQRRNRLIRRGRRASTEPFLSRLLRQAIVFLEGFAQAVVRKSDYGVIVDAGHSLGGDHRVDDRLFGGLNGREENGIERIVREHR